LLAALALRANIAGGTRIAGWTGRTGLAWRANLASSTRIAGWTGGTGGTGLAWRANLSLLAGLALRANLAGSSRIAGRTDGSSRPWRAGATAAGERGAVPTPAPRGVLEERAAVSVTGRRHEQGRVLSDRRRAGRHLDGADHQRRGLDRGRRGAVRGLDERVGKHDRRLRADAGCFEVMARRPQDDVELPVARKRDWRLLVQPDR
jgi:hypothetical protein